MFCPLICTHFFETVLGALARNHIQLVGGSVDNKLDDSQVPHIAALLMKCPKLASITVHWNLFTPASKTMIAKAVASNVGCLEYVS
jgi:hypothetical protein